MELEIEVDGFTLEIDVSNYEPFMSGRFNGPPELCYPDEGGILEYKILNENKIPKDIKIDYYKLDILIEKALNEHDKIFFHDND